MLNKKPGLKLYRWIPTVTLAVLPLVTVVHASSANPVTTPKVEKQAMGLKVAVVAATDTSTTDKSLLH